MNLQRRHAFEHAHGMKHTGKKHASEQRRRQRDRDRDRGRERDGDRDRDRDRDRDGGRGRGRGRDTQSVSALLMAVGNFLSFGLGFKF